MADIQMCFGGNCPQKEQCHRHTAKPNTGPQAVFMELPYLKFPNNKCGHFWDNADRYVTPKELRMPFPASIPNP